MSGDIRDRVVIRKKDAAFSWERLTGLLHEAYKRNADSGLGFAAASQSAEQTKRRVQDGTVFIAFLDEEPIGAVCCRVKNNGGHWYDKGITGHISQFAVLPRFKGEGVGSALLDRAYDFFAENGADGVILDTSEEAEGLIAYYRKSGFIPVDLVCWSNTNYKSVVMKKPLSGETDEKYCLKMFKRAGRRLAIKRLIKGRHKPKAIK